MGKAEQALELLKTDLDQAEQQWIGGKQFMSFLQREDLDLAKLLAKFDPKEDESKWAKEYNGSKDSLKLRIHRKAAAFLKASRKDFHEEYDPDFTDVDFMRLLQLPYTDPRYVIECSKDELKDPK